MEFINKLEPDVKKPLVIAAMQDMGNVGSIAKSQKKNGNTDTVMM